MAIPDDVLTTLNRVLEDRYVLEKEIGQGGMATVYLAEDRTHHRKVALKVLTPDVAHALGPARFLNEIQVAAGLTHPNILPLFDSGDADGLLYYAMPYVEGESLRDRLNRERQLPLDETIRIVGEVADALAHAHEKRLVHRDIKPENILFQAGHAAVADFGIAKGLDAAGGEQLTRTGVTVGTPAYMSPEQFGGSVDLDGRSDLYSLGCVAYEMLAGQPPFPAPTPQAVMARHAVDPVPELRTIRPDIPVGVSRAIHKALAKVPADRFASTRAFGEALRQANTEEARAAEEARKMRAAGHRRLRWGVAVAAMAALAIWGVNALTEPAPFKLAVLPPTNLLNAPEQEPLIQGVHDALIQGFQQAGVSVKARTSMMQYRDGNTPVRQIAHDLGVQALIEPLVRWAGDSVEIDLRLVDGSTEEYLADPIVRAGSIKDILRFYDDLVGQVAGVLGLELRPEAEARLARAHPVDPDAYEDYLNGRFLLGTLNPASFERAQRYFEAALEIDPDFAEAHAGIAFLWGARQQLGLLSPSEAAPRAREALSRALAADSMASYVQDVAAAIRAWVNWDWPGAEASFRRAIETNPSDAEIRAHFSHLLMNLGRWEESEEQINQAMELDPLNPTVLSFYGMTLNYGRRFPEAVSFFEDALQAAPENPVAHDGLMMVYHEMGMHQEALEHAAFLLSMFTGEDLSPLLLDALSERGPREAWKLAAEAFGDHWPTPYETALLFDWAGEQDRAFFWLDEGYRMRDSNLPYVAISPFSDALRSDSRFQDLLERMNLPLSS